MTEIPSSTLISTYCFSFSMHWLNYKTKLLPLLLPYFLYNHVVFSVSRSFDLEPCGPQRESADPRVKQFLETVNNPNRARLSNAKQPIQSLYLQQSLLSGSQYLQVHYPLSLILPRQVPDNCEQSLCPRNAHQNYSD